MSSKSEAEIQQEILLAMELQPGVRIWRQNSGALLNPEGRPVRFGLPGMADLGGIVGPEGWVIQIEVKSAYGRTTEQQRRWLDMCASFGAICIEGRSAEGVVRLFKMILKRRILDLGLSGFGVFVEGRNGIEHEIDDDRREYREDSGGESPQNT